MNVIGTPPVGATTESESCTDCAAPALMVRLDCEKLKAAPTVTFPLPGPKPLAVAVMVALPKLTPFTLGGTMACVCPVKIVTVDRLSVALDGSLLASAIVVFVEAATGKVTTSGVDWPGATVTFETRINPELVIVTVAEPDVIPAAEAVMTEAPGTRPDTGTCTEVAPGPIATVGGTEAFTPLLELRFTVRPAAGAGPESVRLKFCEEPLAKEIVAGDSVKNAVTFTVCVAELNPVAAAVIVEVPAPAPFIVGCTEGVAEPAGMKTLLAESVTDALLEVRLTVMPPDGATEESVTWTGTVWPRVSVALGGICTLPRFDTVTLAVAATTFGMVAEAVITVEPELTPVTGTDTEVAFCRIVTEAGTVAAWVLLDSRFTVRLLGAGPDRARVRLCCAPALRFSAEGVKERAEPTTTRAESPVKPPAVAVMVAEPKEKPVTVAGMEGTVLPAGMVTLLLTVTFDGLLLRRVMMTPPGGATLANVTAIGRLAPGATVMFRSTAICPKRLAFTLALPPVYPGAVPLMLAVPAARPVKENVPLMAPD